MNAVIMERPDAVHWLLQQEIADFLFAEAELLDERRFREWLDLLDEDISYFMPIRRNVKFGQQSKLENTISGEGISWFDDDKWTLTKRSRTDSYRRAFCRGTAVARQPPDQQC